jgi:hypothetical protein
LKVALFLLLLLTAGEPFAFAAPKTAESAYRIAETAEYQLRSFERIAPRLGFAELVKFEDQELLALLNRALIAYFAVFQARDVNWSHRAAYRVAVLVEDFYAEQILKNQPSFRGTILPSPFELGLGLGAPPPLYQNDLVQLRGELELLYSALDTRIKKSGIDVELIKELKAKFQQTPNKSLSDENFVHPWAKDFKPGLLRCTGDDSFELQQGGWWKPLKEKEFEKSLAFSLKQRLGNAAHNYALVASACTGRAITPQRISAAIHHPRSQTRLAGLVAAELKPQSEFLPALLSHWQHLEKTGQTNRVLFGSLEKALFGEPERTLLAIKANIKADTASLQKLHQSTLPDAEKAWLLGTVASASSQSSALLQSNDALAAARALYAQYKGKSKGTLAILQRHLTDKRNLVRLSARRILSLHTSQQAI